MPKYKDKYQYTRLPCVYIYIFFHTHLQREKRRESETTVILSSVILQCIYTIYIYIERETTVILVLASFNVYAYIHTQPNFLLMMIYDDDDQIYLILNLKINL